MSFVKSTCISNMLKNPILSLWKYTHFRKGNRYMQTDLLFKLDYVIRSILIGCSVGH